VTRLRTAGELDAEPDPDSLPVSAAEFHPFDHRWAGWRADEPDELPDDPLPGADAVVAALRRLPLAERAVLVLRDAAGLSVEACAEIVAGTAAEQNRLLDHARDAFTSALAEGVLETGRPRP
jgi:DNA-directed RNA polymerase specialized sigma24 family protein